MERVRVGGGEKRRERERKKREKEREKREKEREREIKLLAHVTPCNICSQGQLAPDELIQFTKVNECSRLNACVHQGVREKEEREKERERRVGIYAECSLLYQ